MALLPQQARRDTTTERPAIFLINLLINAIVKQRRPGAHALHALAQRIIKAYRNHDVEIASNGEAWLVERVAALRPGFVAVDVGANLGEWSGEVLRHSQAGRLLAYEAVPGTFATLSQTIDDPRAELVNAALSDTPGTLQMQAYADQPEFASLHVDYGAVGDVRMVEIEARTGDAEVERTGLDKIDLLKVDTEGHDFAVLKGFAETLGKGAVDVIQFEYNYTTLVAGRSLKMFFDLLGADYLLCRLLPKGLEACCYHPILDDFTQTNWVAIRKGMLDESIVSHFNITPARGIIRRDMEREMASDPRMQKLILG